MARRADRRLRERTGKFLEGLVEELIEWAEAEFRLGRRSGDGATEREHAESADRQWAALGKKPRVKAESENAAEFPEPLGYLWCWFLEILSGQEAGFGPAIVTWEGLAAWCGLTGEAIEPWEAKALVRLGVLRSNVLSEERPKRDTPDKN